MSVKGTTLWLAALSYLLAIQQPTQGRLLTTFTGEGRSSGAVRLWERPTAGLPRPSNVQQHANIDSTTSTLHSNRGSGSPATHPVRNLTPLRNPLTSSSIIKLNTPNLTKPNFNWNMNSQQMPKFNFTWSTNRNNQTKTLSENQRSNITFTQSELNTKPSVNWNMKSQKMPKFNFTWNTNRNSQIETQSQNQRSDITFAQSELNTKPPSVNWNMKSQQMPKFNFTWNTNRNSQTETQSQDQRSNITFAQSELNTQPPSVNWNMKSQQMPKFNFTLNTNRNSQTETQSQDQRSNITFAQSELNTKPPSVNWNMKRQQMPKFNFTWNTNRNSQPETLTQHQRSNITFAQYTPNINTNIHSNIGASGTTPNIDPNIGSSGITPNINTNIHSNIGASGITPNINTNIHSNIGASGTTPNINTHIGSSGITPNSNTNSHSNVGLSSTNNIEMASQVPLSSFNELDQSNRSHTEIALSNYYNHLIYKFLGENNLLTNNGTPSKIIPLSSNLSTQPSLQKRIMLKRHLKEWLKLKLSSVNLNSDTGFIDNNNLVGKATIESNNSKKESTLDDRNALIVPNNAHSSISNNIENDTGKLPGTVVKAEILNQTINEVASDAGQTAILDKERPNHTLWNNLKGSDTIQNLSTDLSTADVIAGAQSIDGDLSTADVIAGAQSNDGDLSTDVIAGAQSIDGNLSTADVIAGAKSNDGDLGTADVIAGAQSNDGDLSTDVIAGAHSIDGDLSTAHVIAGAHSIDGDLPTADVIAGAQSMDRDLSSADVIVGSQGINGDLSTGPNDWSHPSQEGNLTVNHHNIPKYENQNNLIWAPQEGNKGTPLNNVGESGFDDIYSQKQNEIHMPSIINSGHNYWTFWPFEGSVTKSHESTVGTSIQENTVTNSTGAISEQNGLSSNTKGWLLQGLSHLFGYDKSDFANNNQEKRDSQEINSDFPKSNSEKYEWASSLKSDSVGKHNSVVHELAEAVNNFWNFLRSSTKDSPQEIGSKMELPPTIQTIPEDSEILGNKKNSETDESSGAGSTLWNFLQSWWEQEKLSVTEIGAQTELPAMAASIPASADILGNGLRNPQAHEAPEAGNNYWNFEHDGTKDLAEDINETEIESKDVLPAIVQTIPGDTEILGNTPLNSVYDKPSGAGTTFWDYLQGWWTPEKLDVTEGGTQTELPDMAASIPASAEIVGNVLQKPVVHEPSEAGNNYWNLQQNWTKDTSDDIESKDELPDRVQTTLGDSEILGKDALNSLYDEASGAGSILWNYLQGLWTPEKLDVTEGGTQTELPDMAASIPASADILGSGLQNPEVHEPPEAGNNYWNFEQDWTKDTPQDITHAEIESKDVLPAIVQTIPGDSEILGNTAHNSVDGEHLGAGSNLWNYLQGLWTPEKLDVTKGGTQTELPDMAASIPASADILGSGLQNPEAREPSEAGNTKDTPEDITHAEIESKDVLPAIAQTIPGDSEILGNTAHNSVDDEHLGAGSNLWNYLQGLWTPEKLDVTEGGTQTELPDMAASIPASADILGSGLQNPEVHEPSEAGNNYWNFEQDWTKDTPQDITHAEIESKDVLPAIVQTIPGDSEILGNTALNSVDDEPSGAGSNLWNYLQGWWTPENLDVTKGGTQTELPAMTVSIPASADIIGNAPQNPEVHEPPEAGNYWNIEQDWPKKTSEAINQAEIESEDELTATAQTIAGDSEILGNTVLNSVHDEPTGAGLPKVLTLWNYLQGWWTPKKVNVTGIGAQTELPAMADSISASPEILGNAQNPEAHEPPEAGNNYWNLQQNWTKDTPEDITHAEIESKDELPDIAQTIAGDSEILGNTVLNSLTGEPPGAGSTFWNFLQDWTKDKPVEINLTEKGSQIIDTNLSVIENSGNDKQNSITVAETGIEKFHTTDDKTNSLEYQTSENERTNISNNALNGIGNIINSTDASKLSELLQVHNSSKTQFDGLTSLIPLLNTNNIDLKTKIKNCTEISNVNGLAHINSTLLVWFRGDLCLISLNKEI